MARLEAPRFSASRRVAQQRAPARRDPGLLLAVALIIAVAPIGWINAIGQLVLPTNLPARSAPPAPASESREARHGGVAFETNTAGAATSISIPTTIPVPDLLEATPVTTDPDPTPPGVAHEATASLSPVAATEPVAAALSPPVQMVPGISTALPLLEPASATPTAEAPAAPPIAAPTQRPLETAVPVAPPTPRASSTPPASVPATAATTYVVQAGDTLWSISSHYGVGLDELRRANQIGEDNAIRVGQTLSIPRVDGVVHVIAASDALDTMAPQAPDDSAAAVGAPERLTMSVPLAGEAVPVAVSSPSPTLARATATTAPSPTPSTGGAGQVDVRSASRVPGASARLQWPALGGISTFFGETGHTGLDIMGSMGQPVSAAAPGVVTYLVQSDEGYGWRIDVDHGNGVTTVYAHLSEFNVSLGDRVSAGQRIGSVGSTGLSTGPHLHFEVRTGGLPVDPLDYLRSPSG